MTARQVVHSMLNTKSALAAVILATAILPLASAVPVEARSGGQHHAHPAANPAPGSWTRLGLEQGGNWSTFAHLPNGNDLVVWSAPAAQSHQHYEWVELKPNGGMAGKPKDVFGGHDWSGVGQYPVLLLDKGKPLLVFGGGSKGDANNRIRTIRVASSATYFRGEAGSCNLGRFLRTASRRITVEQPYCPMGHCRQHGPGAASGTESELRPRFQPSPPTS